MKRRRILTWAAVLVLVLAVAAAAVWFSPARFNRLDADGIESIRLFSGQTGQGVTVTDVGTIEKICEALDCTLKPDGISLGYMGYALRVTVTERGGGETEFIVNSSANARRDPFFYRASEGEMDYDFLLGLIDSK